MSIYNDSNSKQLNPENNFEQFGIFMHPCTDEDGLVRYVLESISGIITGSDNQPNSVMYNKYKKNNYLGEGITDSRVWGIQSNSPY